MQPVLHPSAPPSVNKRNPHELHWRAEPPEWQGQIDFSYEFYYQQLADKVICRHCGAIPCPIDHATYSQDQYKQLSFIKDMSKEHKDLNLRCQQLTVEVNGLTRNKKALESEKLVMQAEIYRLQDLVSTYDKRLAGWKNDQRKIKTLTQELQAVTTAREHILEELEETHSKLTHKTVELQKSERKNDYLHRKMETLNESMNRLRVELDETVVEKEGVQEQLNAKSDEVTCLKTHVSIILRELQQTNKFHQDRESETQALLNDLRDRVRELHDKAETADQVKEELLAKIDSLTAQVAKLQWRLTNESKFVEFVGVKRELKALKEDHAAVLSEMASKEREDNEVFTSDARGGKSKSRPKTPSGARRVKSATSRTCSTALAPS